MEKPNPKPVSISSLAMRFYESDGWTKKLLEEYLLRGTLESKSASTLPEHGVYWILSVHSQLDVDRLYNEGHVGKLYGRELWGELNGFSDLEVLKLRNW